MYAGTAISLGPSSGAEGASVTTPVSLVSTDSLVGLQIDFGFDPAVVAVGEPSLGTALGSPFEVSYSIPREGILRVLVYSVLNNAFDNGQVLNVPLTFSQTVASGTRGLEVVEVQLANSGGLNASYALAPYVEILSPSDESEIRIGQELMVEVGAFASTGSLRSVELFVDNVLTDISNVGSPTFAWTASSRGEHNLVVVATNESDVKSQVSIALSVLSRFDDWAAINFDEQGRLNPFTSGAKADPDRDGVPNGIEYIRDSDPNAPDSGYFMKRELVTLEGVSYNQATVEYAADVSDVEIQMLATSEGLMKPGDVPVLADLVEEVVDSANNTVRRVYRDPVAIGATPRFMYLQVGFGTN